MNEFDFRGGHFALDFTNTVMSRAGEKPRELLHTFADLLDWAKNAAVIDRRRTTALRRTPPRTAARALRRARILREAIYAAFATGSPAALRTVESFAKSALRHRSLETRGGRIRWTFEEGSPYEIEWRIAEGAAGLLTSEVRDRVRTCNGERCRWLFIDNSRAANRRWCDMNVCGNREKARRHYARAHGRRVV